MTDEGWDLYCGKPTYDFTVVWYPDYPENDPDAILMIAVGQYLCVTPPVIPRGEE